MIKTIQQVLYLRLEPSGKSKTVDDVRAGRECTTEQMLRLYDNDDEHDEPCRCWRTGGRKIAMGVLAF